MSVNPLYNNDVNICMKYSVAVHVVRAFSSAVEPTQTLLIELYLTLTFCCLNCASLAAMVLSETFDLCSLKLISNAVKFMFPPSVLM